MQTLEAPAKVDTLTCPECGGSMQLKRSGRLNKPWFYGCTNYPTCTATHGAHPDGAPLGIPCDRATKRARVAAHTALDALWLHAPAQVYSNGPEPGKKTRKDAHLQRIARHRAYAWLAHQLGLTRETCHIGMFDSATCERVVELCRGLTAVEVRTWWKQGGAE